MIVYVESNFVLEVAFEQEQVLVTNTILQLAETDKIRLIFPSFVLSEPFETIMRRKREREDMHKDLTKMLNQLNRSHSYKKSVLDIKTVTEVLLMIHVKQLELLYSTFEKLLTYGQCIEIDALCFKEALQYQQSLGLAPQDSIIYAAIISHLKTSSVDEQKCFLSQDRKAFDNDRGIKDELAKYNCRYIGNFGQGLNFIHSVLQQEQAE